MRHPLKRAGNSRKFLHMIVPRCEVAVADGPVAAMTVPRVSFEVQITQSVRLSRPHDGLPAEVEAARPLKWRTLRCRIWEFPLGRPKSAGGLRQRIAGTSRVGGEFVLGYAV